MRKKDLRQRILDFLKNLLAQITIDKTVRYIRYLFETALKMKCIDITQPVEVTGVNVDNLETSSDVSFIDKDLSRGRLSHRSVSPKNGRYKLISFHNGSGGISIWTIRVIVRILFGTLANLDETLAVGENCCFKELGLEHGCTIAALGTIIKKPAVVLSWFSLAYSPIVGFVAKDGVGGKKIKEKNIRLHYLSDNYPSDKYILVRVR